MFNVRNTFYILEVEHHDETRNYVSQKLRLFRKLLQMHSVTFSCPISLTKSESKVSRCSLTALTSP